jgi:FlaG protein
MDVQAIDSTGAAATATATAAATATGTAPAASGTDTSQPVGKLLAAFPAPPSLGPKQPPDETLHKALSQLVGGAHVSVQFRVVEGTHDIVTVFKNADTGEVITQFPPEALVLIAQFFNKLAGAVVDRTA